MSHTEQLPILIKANAAATIGSLHVTVYDKHDRMIRAGKLLAIFWGFAVASIFIPIAHFALVPGFLLAGPLMAYFRYRVISRSENAVGQCPVNKNDIAIRLKPSDHLPLWTYCPVCEAPLQLIEKSTL